MTSLFSPWVRMYCITCFQILWNKDRQVILIQACLCFYQSRKLVVLQFYTHWQSLYWPLLLCNVSHSFKMTELLSLLHQVFIFHRAYNSVLQNEKIVDDIRTHGIAHYENIKSMMSLCYQTVPRAVPQRALHHLHPAITHRWHQSFGSFLPTYNSLLLIPVHQQVSLPPPTKALCCVLFSTTDIT